MKARVNCIERDNKKFYYVDFGFGYHGKPYFRLWIASKLVEQDENNFYATITGRGKRIVKTEKGNYVLIPDPDYYCVFNIGWKCGFRGFSDYEILSKAKAVVELELPYEIWDSELGSLGQSRYALVSTKSDRLIVKLTRTGRTYGKPKKRVVEYFIDSTGEQNERELPPACFEDTELAELL